MASKDTVLGGQDSRFPATRFSAIEAASSKDEQMRRQGLESIVCAYWKPVYKTIRIKWCKSNDDAKDLTQAFFAIAIEKNYFADFDASKAKFRTFLRMCLNGFLQNEDKANRRLKRGGNFQILSIDFSDAERELAYNDQADDRSPEAFFEREWLRSLYAQTVQVLENKLESQNKALYFEVFKRYDLADENKPSYAEIADHLQLPVTQVTNLLAYARREFRQLLLQNLRTITANEREFREEVQALLGAKD